MEEIPKGYEAGVVFDTITVNPEEYLPWLKNQLLSFGVAFIRQKLQTLDEAAELAGLSGIIVNATALGWSNSCDLNPPAEKAGPRCQIFNWRGRQKRVSN